jgi:IS30 family transposase
MAKTYEQLSLDERIELNRMRKDGQSLRSIAATLGRAASTVSRELARNSKATKAWCAGYEPARAHQLAERRRRWDARFKLARNSRLRHFVHQRLEQGWSPEQIAGHLQIEYGYCIISHESIYRFIYYRSEQKDYWHRLLPRRKSRRGRLVGMRWRPMDHIQERVSIRERPGEVSTRNTPGHWEGDLMLFSRYSQALLMTHERSSRLLIAQRQPNKAASPWPTTC